MSGEQREQKGEPITSLTLSFEHDTVTLDATKLANASLGNAFKATQILQNATLTLIDQDKALAEVGLDTNEKIRLLYDYLGVASRKKRGSSMQFELDQVKKMHERLASRFPETDTSQAQDRGGRKGKKGRRWQSGGFDQRDTDDTDW